MSHLRNLGNLASIAAFVGALSYTGMAQAQQTSTTVTTAQPQPPQPTTTVVQQPPPQPPSQVVVQPAAPAPPVSTTTTTASPYAPAPVEGEQYHERSFERRPNRTLLRTGIGIFAVSYVASGIGGLASTRDSDGYLLVPLVGPWIDLGNRGCENRPCGDREGTNKAAIVTAGVFQTVGALLTVGAFFIPEGTTVTHEEQHVAATKPEVHVTPISFGTDGAGVGAIGRF